MPTNTDLVTDLPADFEVFGQAVDSSMADLKGGTSGQILSKATNTDMDFTWIDNQVGDITAVTADSPLTGGGTTGAISIGIQDGTTAQKGAVQLTDSTSSTSTTTAATPKNVKAAYDLAAAAIPASTATTAGDILFRNGSAVTRLPIGTAGQVLKVNSGATAPEWAASSGGGKVLQVVQGTTTTQASSSSATLVDSGLSVSITPSSATSKILVLITQTNLLKPTNDTHIQIELIRDSTSVYTMVGLAQAANGGILTAGIASGHYLDSPATTSAITYKTQFKNTSAAGTVFVQYAQNVATSTIVAMEIGA